MTTGTLVDLVRQANLIQQAIIEAGGELLPETEVLLDQNDVALVDKLDRYHIAIERLEMDAEYWKTQANKYTAIAKGCENAAERMKGRIKNAMMELKIPEIEGVRVKYKLCNAQPKLVLTEDLLSATMLVEIIEWKPDRQRIRAELEAGKEIIGAKLEPNFSLRKYEKKEAQK